MNVKPIPAIYKTDWKTHSRELIHIRTQVFMEEQQVTAKDEWDGLDDNATHFLITVGQQAIGCARLLIEQKNNQRLFHIGRVAIIKAWRHQGFGHQLMQHAIHDCQEQSPGSGIYLHAQCERQHFYEKLGFIVQSEIFMDAGIPHITMTYTGTV